MKAPAPDAPRTALETWFAARLLPLNAPRVHPPARSDYDLNPMVARPDGDLTYAAVLVGLIERGAALNLILTRRADHLRRHSGQVAFPGGRLDPGETPVTGALREAEEEIGLDRRLVTAVGQGDCYQTVTGFAVTPVVGFVAGEAELLAQEAEVAEVFEVPFAWAMDSRNYVHGSREVQGERRHYEALHYGERMIWGATAGVLRGLRERLFGHPT